MNFHTFIALALATWRLSKLLVEELGPFDVFDKIRIAIWNSSGGDNKHPIGAMLWGLFSCVWCMSVWVGGLMALTWYYMWYHPLAKFAIYALAFSAVAIVVDSLVTGMYHIGSENSE